MDWEFQADMTIWLPLCVLSPLFLYTTGSEQPKTMWLMWRLPQHHYGQSVSAGDKYLIITAIVLKLHPLIYSTISRLMPTLMVVPCTWRATSCMSYQKRVQSGSVDMCITEITLHHTLGRWDVSFPPFAGIPAFMKSNFPHFLFYLFSACFGGF